jgi:hypothetical protein
VSKETYYIVKRGRRFSCAQEAWREEKEIDHKHGDEETFITKETYYNVKRDLLVSKETYYSVKRDLLQCQKRPITVLKETYYSVKRDLLQCQKRPIAVSKEADHKNGDKETFITK